MRRTWLILVATACVLASAGAAHACPSCGNAIAKGESGEVANLTTAFYYSILFMLAVPLTLLIGFSASFYSMHRQAEQNATATEAGAHTLHSAPAS